jgi:hypothetical protein
VHVHAGYHRDVGTPSSLAAAERELGGRVHGEPSCEVLR